MKADILLQEEFSSTGTPAGWTSNAVQGTQQWIFQSTPTLGSLSGGGYAVFDDFVLGAGVTPNEAILTTPTVNCTGRVAMRLRYYHYWHAIEFTHGYVEISNDGGTSWTTIVDYEKDTKGSLLAPQDTVIDISTYADNQPDVKVRFRYTDGSQAGRYWYLDDVAIYSGLDVGIVALTQPTSLLCGESLTANDTVKVEIYNYSIDTIWNVPVVCKISGDLTTTLNETHSGFIPPLSSVVHTFGTALDLSGDNKLFIFNIYTSLAGESYVPNDTLHATRQSSITGYPYHENLMVSNYDWKPTGDPSFEFGAFTKMNGNGQFGNSWVTQLVGAYDNGLDAYIESPIFDFTNTPPDPILTYEYKYYTEPCCDFAELQYSINGSSNWTVLSDRWKGDGFMSWNQDTILLDFDNCAISCVQFRFYFRSDGSATRNGGFTFDNFKITPNAEVNDAVVEDIIYDTDCSYSNMIPIGLSIKNNNGYHLCQEVVLTSEATHPSLPTQTFIDTLLISLMGNEIQDFNHSIIADFSGYNSGDYTVTSTVYFADDIDPSNNTIVRTVPFVINTFPYFEDFDADKGGWRRVGNRDFEYGAFTKMNGNAGFGNSWVTKLNGNYSNSQNSFVESPVFDLTNMVCPAVIFDYKYFTESCCDYAYLQYSTNGGANWTNLIGNWRGDAYNEWNYAEINIANLVGNPCVQFRFWFRSDGSAVRDGGFAFDNFSLQENENNVSVTNIIAPVMTSEFCNRRTNQTITAEIYNGGCNPVFNIPIEVDMTGANTLNYSEIIPDTILSGQTFQYTFTNTLDMSDTGTYFIVINTSFALDPDIRNDTFDIEIYEEYAIPVIDTYPHIENFDTSLGGWFVVEDTEFELGSFTKMNGNSGFGNSWVTKLVGAYSNSTHSYIYSPIYDLYNTPPEPVLEFDYKYYTESCCDLANLQYSLDGGQNWTVLAGDWKGDSYIAWNHETIILDFLTCDISCVQFRFYLKTDGSATRDGGLAFDNFNITPNVMVNDATIDDFLIDKNCTYGAAEQFGVSIKNNNRYRICEEIEITSIITHPTLPTQTLTETFTAAIPPNFFQNFYYPSLIDLSGYTTGDYTVTSYVFFPEDIDHNNDTLVGTIPFLVNSYPYFEDFDSGKRGWSSEGDEIFELGPFTKMDGNAGFGSSWVTKVTGDYGNNTAAFAESPVFDLTSVTCPAILFDYKYYTESCCDRTRLQYSLDGGANWSTLTGDWRGDAFTEWSSLEYNIQSLAGNSCVQFRFWFHSDGSAVRDGGFAFDNFQLKENENNVSVVSILKPESEYDLCERRLIESVMVEVYNGGCNTLTNVPIEVNMTGALSQNINEIITDPIASGQTYTYTFTNTLNMSDTGTYYLQVNTNLPTDPENANDTLFTSVYEEFAVPIVNTFPYNEDFDAGVGNWFHTGTPYFELGTFTKMGGNSGYGDSWVTKLAGDYDNNTNAYINSPIYDLTNLVCPSISYNYKVYSESCCDRATLQYSLNGGNNWTTLSTYNGDNYVNWDFEDINISALAGNSCVQFRFYWRADGSAVRTGGFAFDNVTIQENDFNLSMIRLIDPAPNPSLCSNREQQQVTIELYNNGCSDVTNVPVELTLFGQASANFTEVIPGPIPDQGAFLYTFTNTIDLSDTGTYNFIISTNLSLDPNNIDDTITASIFETYERTIVNTFPYVEDFNSGAANWTPTGTNTFELGPFTKMNGNAGFGDSWVTKLSGNYSNNTNAYLVSPTFDLSNTVCPVVTFDHKYYTEACCDYAWLQYSLNGGTSWTNLVGDYRNDGYNDWNHVNYNINSLIGNSCVIFRFWFRSDGSATRDGGFAFDNFEINDVAAEAAVDNVVACWGSVYDFEVTIKNNIDLYCTQQDSIENIVLEYWVDGVTGSQTYTGLNIQAGTADVLTLNNVLIPTANSTIKIWQKLPNSIIDPFHENDTLTLNASIFPNCNDHCSNAQLLVIGTTTASQTSNATQNNTEDPPFNNCGAITVENTVWYTFSTNQDGGEVTIDFENINCAPSANGIQVSIDELTGPPCQAGSLTNLYCNSPTDTVPFGYGPVVLPPNTTFYIIVDGFAGNNCDFDIVLDGAIFDPNPTGEIVVNNHVACFGENNGSATIMVSNGRMPYTYNWSNGAMSATATGLSAGMHSITVTEFDGNTFIDSVLVTEPPQMVTSSAVVSVACNGSTDGTASVSASGGTPGYTYNWSSGGTTSSVSGLSAGLYSVTITDLNGCEEVESIQIDEPPSITANTNASPTTCNGSTDGMASVTASGGTSGYTYNWSSGGTVPSLTGLAAGVYTVTITDMNGCTLVETVQVTEPTGIQASTTITSISCNSSGAGSASVSVSGGTPNYTYLWDSGATTSVVSGLLAGMHSVTITDMSGCSIVETVQISEPSGLEISVSSTAVVCHGEKDGTATVTISGGTPGYSYIWDTGATTAVITGLSPGTYSVTATDMNGCSETETIQVAGPSGTPMFVFVNTTQVSCGSVSDGTAMATPTYGTMPYSYQWDANANNQTTALATGLTLGSYMVTVTDNNGCYVVDGIFIREESCDFCQIAEDNNTDICAVLSADPNDPLSSLDCDGDGVINGTECTDLTDPSDPCDFEDGSITEPVTADQSECLSLCQDLAMVTRLIPNNIVGPTPISIQMDIVELNGVDTDPVPITVRMPSDPRLTFIWNITANPNWNYIGNNGLFHVFTFVGNNGVILGGSTETITIGITEGLYNPQGTDGITSISPSIVPYSGGECIINNNTDPESLVYFW